MAKATARPVGWWKTDKKKCPTCPVWVNDLRRHNERRHGATRRKGKVRR